MHTLRVAYLMNERVLLLLLHRVVCDARLVREGVERVAAVVAER